MVNPENTRMCRETLAKHIRSPIESYKREDVYRPGKVIYNFQLDTTVDPAKPYSTSHLAKRYEELIVDYVIGKKVDLPVNGGAILILRGATGSGKTTAIMRVIERVALLSLANTEIPQTDVLRLDLNHISNDFFSDGGESTENSFQCYLWRCLAEEINCLIDGETLASPEFQEGFRIWVITDKVLLPFLPGVAKFRNKNIEYIQGIISGAGFLQKSVDDLREIVYEEWRLCLEGMGAIESSRLNIARFLYSCRLTGRSEFAKCIIVDNADALDPRFQRQVVDAAMWLAHYLKVRLIIALRPLTWQNLHGHHTLDVEEHCAPSLADVMVARIDYITKYLLPEKADREFARYLVAEIRNPSGHLRSVIYGASGISVRTALRNLYNFLSSSRLDHTQSSSKHSYKPSAIARAFFHGAEECISHENIDDLYAVDGVRSFRLALLKPRILDFVARVRGGRTTLLEIWDFTRGFGFDENEFRVAVNELMRRKRSLLWCEEFHKLEDSIDLTSRHRFCIAPTGSSYYARLLGEYLYTEACLAPDNHSEVSPAVVIAFSRDLIREDEVQIECFLASDSKYPIDYHKAYGFDTPSIAYVYWSKFIRGLEGRTIAHGERRGQYDPDWENRIRGFMSEKLGINYFTSGKLEKP